MGRRRTGRRGTAPSSHNLRPGECDEWRKNARRAGLPRSPCARIDGRVMTELEDATISAESPFAKAIREHLELRARNAGLDNAMPLDPYLNGGDPLENHPLFKSEEQARIEETLDGEPAAELSSTRLPWPGEETVEDVESHALDDTLWTGR